MLDGEESPGSQRVTSDFAVAHDGTREVDPVGYTGGFRGRLLARCYLRFQLVSVTYRMILRATVFWLLLWCWLPLANAARFVAVVPQPANAERGDFSAAASERAARAPVDEASPDSLWLEYLTAWQQHFNDPADAATRRRLGLPTMEAVSVEVSDGASAAGSLARTIRVRWSQPLRVETDHFLIVADVPRETALEIAHDLEQYFAVWTQLFFPLWKDRQRWDQSSRRSASRGAVMGGKMRVVVFRDPDQYAAALAAEGPAIGRSTGYYSGSARLMFLRQWHSGEAASDAQATRYHELTHQLLAEATESRLRVPPGERQDFWLLEGIACYMESTAIADGLATVGGWEASRLQFARHRALVSGQRLPLEQLQTLGRQAFQRHEDLAQLYAFAASYCHQLIDHHDGDGLRDMLSRLAKLYQVRFGGTPRSAAEPTDLAAYLRLDDARLTPLSRDDLSDLCLARCSLQPESLRRITPQRSLNWLDLTGLPVQSTDVMRLCPTPTTLRQLSLEATAVDDTLTGWLAKAEVLQELDLSWTRAGDACLASLPASLPLETLWLTGSQVSDHSLERIAAFKHLQRVDLQRTAVTAAGRQRLRELRPDLTLDPLELVAAP